MHIRAFFYVALVTVTAQAVDLNFGDPRRVPPPPDWAIGFADRSPALDVLPGFVAPPAGFGDVGFYWWMGDPLTRERLQWQIDQLAGRGVTGLQINYAHSDRGGRSYGLTFPSEPPLFSEEWWSLFQWFVKAAKEKGMAVSLSDYTLGFGQGWYVDEVLRENPGLNGSTLHHEIKEVREGEPLDWKVPIGTLSASAYRRPDAKTDPTEALDLREYVKDGRLRWTAPGGTWQVVAVGSKVVPWSLDPMNMRTGPEIIEKFFQRFEDRNPGEAGKGLNFFFSDELGFGVGGNLWTERFAEEFRKRKGYDVIPDLAALFVDIGPRTPKVRLDYRDVLVVLSEEGFFKPLFDWHQERGMIYGCDHGGRGKDVAEFGDYFRTQRWNQGPGSDQPQLGRDLIKAKVASSIAHLYLRPRVWLEGFYSSGWGTSTAQLTDTTFVNFAMGYNLLTLHGLYYSTHGGWWEWAPPCNHFRMPYWQHMTEYMMCVQRLSYLMSQGHHVCDVAVMYPVAPSEADLDGAESVKVSFETARELYGRAMDFDFIDFESVARAQVKDGKLSVSGENYQALVIPSMKAVRFSTVEKAVEFQRAGGLVIMVGALPEASDRAGRNDPELSRLVEELQLRVADANQVPAAIESKRPRDYDGPGYVQHRRIGSRDVYMVYGVEQGTECTFRATGKVELWDPWSGKTRPLAVVSQASGFTRIKMPLTAKEAHLVVFSPGEAEKSAGPEERTSAVAVDGIWEFQLQPVLDNRFGDFHWPPTPTLIGAEVRQLEFAPDGKTNGPWRKVSCSFGPKFWKLGPLPAEFEDSDLVRLSQVNPEVPVRFGGKEYEWQPYEFSWRWGKEGDPGHQGYHGLKEKVSDQFICLGAPRPGHNETLYGPEPGGTRYYLWTSVPVNETTEAYAYTEGLKPSRVWLNHQTMGEAATLRPGANPLLLRYDRPGRSCFVLETVKSEPGPDAVEDAFAPATPWIWYPGARENGDRWFRREFTLTAAPGKARLRITCDNTYNVSINGQPVGEGERWESVQEYDIAQVLRPGTNVVLVRAGNTGDAAGLIADLKIDGLHITTDTNWLAGKTAADPGIASEEIARFAKSLWYEHASGPPRLQVQAPTEPEKFKVSPLAMRWHNRPETLPFDLQPEKEQPVGWYRFVSPPGLRAMKIKARGKVQAWSNGEECRADGEERFAVARPAAQSANVVIRIESERGAYGGAGIPEPIELECGPGEIATGDWAKIDGLYAYSGGAWYRKTLELEKTGRTLLDLGDVVSSAELHVNGNRVGTRVAPPWVFDISDQVKAGQNRIEVLVFNTLANHYTSIPTMYRGSPVSGLLGPVKVITSK